MNAEHRFDESDELRLVIRAESFPEAAAEAGRALAALIAPSGVPESPGDGWKEIEVAAPDPAALLVDWINELIFRAESEGWLGVEFRMSPSPPGRLSARVRGVAWPSRSLPVKAATLDRAAVTAAPLPEGVRAEVTLDV